MKSSTYFSATACLLGLACFTLCAISLGTSRWNFVISKNQEFGLFERCPFAQTFSAECTTLNIPELDAPYIQATRAFMIMGTLLVGIGAFVALVAAFGKGKKMNIIAGILFLLSSLFLLTACAVYTGQSRQLPFFIALSSFGYSLWIGWAATILSFLNIPFAFLAKPSKPFLS